jgi:NAD(P)-dependent dehydrogenase (short-subunit alcohol dehydrogenase family)
VPRYVSVGASATGLDELFAVNVKGYLLGARAAAEALRPTRGSMIFTLSNASFFPRDGGPLYTASEHAGLGLVRQLAYELAFCEDPVRWVWTGSRSATRCRFRSFSASTWH